MTTAVNDFLGDDAFSTQATIRGQGLGEAEIEPGAHPGRGTAGSIREQTASIRPPTTCRRQTAGKETPSIDDENRSLRKCGRPCEDASDGKSFISKETSFAKMKNP